MAERGASRNGGGCTLRHQEGASLQEEAGSEHPWAKSWSQGQETRICIPYGAPRLPGDLGQVTLPHFSLKRAAVLMAFSGVRGANEGTQSRRCLVHQECRSLLATLC